MKTASQPSPCPHCRAGVPTFVERDWSVVHRRVFTRRPHGRPEFEDLGACLDPPKRPEAKHAENLRSAEECMKRIHELATKGSAVSVLVEARKTFTERSQPREPGSDDE